MLNFENKKGITLIALVITIIVLLILAGVSIATLTGNNGVITQSVKAKTEDTHSQLLEEMQLETQSYQIEVSTGKFEGTLIDYLNRNSDKPIVNNDGVINVKNLLGKTLPLGNGTSKETGDVYVLEQEVEVANENGDKEVTKIASLDNVKVAETKNATIHYQIVYYGKTFEEIANLGSLINEDFSYEEENLEYSYLYSVNNDGKLSLNSYYSYYSYIDQKQRVYLFSENGFKLANINLVLPSIINGKKITTISGFSTIEELEKVKIPDGIKEIGYRAFASSGLEEIQIPTSVEKIEESAFFNCNNLTTIYYEGSAAEWNAIEIDMKNNTPLSKINILYNQKEDKITESAVESTVKREELDDYWAYVWNILNSLSEDEKKELYYEGELYWKESYYNYFYPNQEITKELIAKDKGFDSYEELLEKEIKYYGTLERCLIELKYVKPAGYFEE